LLRAIGTVDHVPITLAWPPHRKVRLAVPVIVARDRDIAGRTRMLPSARPTASASQQ
jgi:hypothetical protein